MTEDGIEVIELSGEELQEFKDVTAPIYDQWREVLGSDVMDQVRRWRTSNKRPFSGHLSHLLKVCRTASPTGK